MTASASDRLKFLSSPILLTIIALLGVGLVQVYSSSYIFATESYGDALYFFKRQAFFVITGFFLLVTMTQIPLEKFERWSWLFWIAAGVGVLVTFIPGLGIRAGGAARWIRLPFGLRFEPSELLKLSFTLLFASILVRSENILSRFKWPVLLSIFAVPIALLLKQPDFGSFAIIICVAIGLLFVFGLKWRYILTSFAIVIPAFYFLVMTKDYRRARVLSFLDPWSDPEQKGFQVIQSMLSFHSGGVIGSGIGQGQGKLFFLPEAHTDFTLAVFGEEMGFVGFIILLSLYGFLVLRGFQIGVKAENKFHKAVAIGFSMTFAMSIFINAGVVMGLLPTKGLTLPFLSYGGSSLLMLCFMFGLILNIEKSVSANQSPFFRNKSRLQS